MFFNFFRKFIITSTERSSNSITTKGHFIFLFSNSMRDFSLFRWKYIILKNILSYSFCGFIWISFLVFLALVRLTRKSLCILICNYDTLGWKQEIQNNWSEATKYTCWTNNQNQSRAYYNSLILKSMLIKHFNQTKCNSTSDKGSISSKWNFSEGQMIFGTSFAEMEHIVRANNAKISSNDND